MAIHLRGNAMIIDCHGHYTTEPKPLMEFRQRQIAAFKDKQPLPSFGSVKIGDDEFRASVEGNQLRIQRERGTALTLFSPRASGMVHVSASCNPAFHTTGAHYINADTTAFMQFITGDLFKDLPALRLIVPHGGGAAPYHWGRYRGLAQNLNRPPLPEMMRNNVFFDTCVYHQPGIDLLLKLVSVDNILFASEMLGAVKGVDPSSGHEYDDTRRYIDASSLSAAEKQKIFEGNARKVYPRIGKKLDGMKAAR